MAYKVIGTQSALASAKAYETLATNLETLRKKLLTAPGVIKDAKTKLETKGKEVKAQLKTDMAAIRANYDAHSRTTEAAKAASDNALKAAKDAYERYKKVPALPDADKVMDALNKCTIHYEASVEDAAAYGKAWADYRAFNPSAHKVDKIYLDEFTASRSTLMADGKSITLKIEQMKQNITQLDAIVNQMKSVKARTMAAAQSDANQLATSIAGLLKDLKEAKGVSKTSFEMGINTVAASPTNPSYTAKDYPTVEASYKNMINTLNTWKVKLKAMQTTYDAGKSGFNANELNDATVKAHLLACDKALKEGDGLVKLGQAAIPQAAQSLTALRNKLGIK
jgi:hypothetical protein